MADPFVPVVDREGRSQTLSPEEATAAYRSGQYAVPGERVPVRHSDGTVGTVSADELSQFIADPRARLASPEELAAERHAMENGGVGGTLAAAGIGAAHGLLPFGIGQNLVTAFSQGRVDSEEQRRFLDENPVTGTTAEIAGSLAPMLLTGGASGAARGTAAAVEGVEAVGNLARGAEAANVVREAAAVGGVPVRTGATLAGVRAGVPTIAEGIPSAQRATRAGMGGDVMPTLADAVAPGSVDAMATMPGRAGVVAPEELFLSEDAIGTRAFGASRTAEGAVPIRIGRNEAATDTITVPEQQALDAFDAVQAASEEFPGQRAAVAAQESMSEIVPQGPALREFPALAPSQGNEIVGGIATRPGMARVEMPIVTPEMLAPARTAAIEAGVPVLGREALAVEEALVTGNRAGFADTLRSVARFHPYNAASELGSRAGALLGESRLGRAAGSAVQGALEGSVYGASNYVNRSQLEDEPLTAEGLAMAIGEGALFGGGANLALHGVGGLVGAARRGLPNASLAQSFERTMNRSAVSALHPNATAYTRLTERFIPGEAGQAAARGGMRNVDDMGAFLIKEGLFESPRGIMPPSIQEIAQRLEASVTEARMAVASPVRTAQEAGSRVVPTNLRAVIKQHVDEMMTSPLASVREQGKRVRDEFAMLSDHERPTSFHSMRQKFDDKAHFEQGNQAHNAEVAMYQDFRRAAQKDLQAAVDAASPELGAAYRVANDRLGKLAWANTAAQKAVGRNLAGSNLPLGSLISGAGAGALFGGVSPQALAVGFLSGALHKWVKDNGAALATSGLSAMMKANTLNRVATAVRSNAVRSVKDAFATAARVGVVRAAASRPLSDRQFQQAATSLYALSHDPEATLAASQPLQGIQASAPSAGLAAQQVQAARLQYLANLLPGAQAPDPLSALVAIRSATPAQMAQFGKAFAIAKDPSVYLQSFADHTITAETTAHMRALWPATYGTMAQTLMTELESRNEPLSPGMRRTVSVFMGQQPVDQSPAYIMLMQANYGTQPTQGGQPQAASGAPAIDGVAERALTGPQATEARIAAGGPGS